VHAKGLEAKKKSVLNSCSVNPTLVKNKNVEENNSKNVEHRNVEKG